MTAPSVELCVGAVVVVDDAVLLVRRANPPGRGRWSLPGGRVESGETLREAVVREVAEETGLRVVCDRLVGWVERIDDDHHFVILDFAATPLDDQEPRAGSDAADVRMVPVWEVAELDLVDGLIEFLGDHGVVDTLS